MPAILEGLGRRGKIGLVAGLAVAALAVVGFHRPIGEFLSGGDRPLRYGKVSEASGAVVRSEPSQDAPLVRAVPRAAILAVLEPSGREDRIPRAKDDQWFRVRL